METALKGIKVVDLSRMAPGPFCTMALGDLGAEVIRVEEPGGGRMARERGAGAEQAEVRRRAAFNALNRNKRSIALNLKHQDAQGVLHRLVEDADVFVEGFRPGVVSRLGCDYETLAEINRKLVYCSLSGYGQDGPYSDLVGHDINYISVGGALGVIGASEGPPIIPYNIIADYAGGGFHAAMAILAALMARQHTGRGQYVDIAMSDGRGLHASFPDVRILRHWGSTYKRRNGPERRRSLLQRVPMQGRRLHQCRLYRAVVLVGPLPSARTRGPDRGAVRAG